MADQINPPSSPQTTTPTSDSPASVQPASEVKRVRDEAPPSVHRSIWQNPFVQNVLPFATSLALHIGLIVVGIATAKAVQTVIKVVEEQIIVPDAQIIEGAEIGGITNPGLGSDPTRTSAQDQLTEAMASNSQAWQQAPSQSLNQNLMSGGGAGESTGDSLIGVGASTGTMGRGRGSGTGSGDGIGSGSGGGGGRAAAAPFGLPGGGGGIGPKSPFMGISGNAKKVIYLCDGSGSMMGVFDNLRRELTKAIDVLKPIQGFNIIIFSGEEVFALSRQGLVLANPDNKRKAVEFVGKAAPSSSTNPFPAIQMAFKQSPELVYVLTDGFDNVASFDDVINEFRKLNKDKKVRVNTILIRAAENAELERVLRTIADENGGVFKIVEKENF